jgi:hypothetical protein
MVRVALGLCVLLLASCTTAPVAVHHVDWDELRVVPPPGTAAEPSATWSAPAQTVAGDDVNHLTVLVGFRQLAESDAEDLDLDEQPAVGVEFDSFSRSTGHGFEVGYARSSEDGSFGGFDADATFDEIYAGYRMTIRPDEADFQSYASLGVTFIKADLDLEIDSDDDTDIAPYVRLGLLWPLGDAVRLGLDYRHVFAGFDLLGSSFDGDYDQVALTLGFPF